MLSVPTLWTVFVINFLALGMIWAYVMRCYPSFDAARFWTGSAFAAAAGASLAMLRVVFPDSLVPLLFGGTALILAICLAAMGIRKFFYKPVSWLHTALITAFGFAGLSFFIFVHDSVPARMTVFTIAQVLPMVILVLVFLSMALNFGFLLMAMDRLRNEVADLALLDDLTGVGNRRHLVQRLSEECARSEGSGEPFALLVIDLDGFKSINDTYGHAAGDACLQHFTLMAQTRLRHGDILARTGGDEFCILLPASTLREGAMIARRVLEVCREDAAGCVGADVPISLSIGVAQWTREIGPFADRMMAAADHALYAAKNNGKNRYAVYDPAPPLAPAIDREPMPQLALRKHA